MAAALLTAWLGTIDYDNLSAGIQPLPSDRESRFTVYSTSGVRVLADAESTASLPSGLYIVNGRKKLISR